MRTIVVTGAHSNVGKTELASSLCGLIPGAVHVKIGHGEEKSGMDNIFLHMGAGFDDVVDAAGGADYVVIESNSIMAEIKPDCAIYLPGGKKRKPTAALAARKADVVRGEPVGRGVVERLVERLDLPETAVLEIIRLAGSWPEDAPPSACGDSKEIEEG